MDGDALRLEIDNDSIDTWIGQQSVAHRGLGVVGIHVEDDVCDLARRSRYVDLELPVMGTTFIDGGGRENGDGRRLGSGNY